MTRDWLKVVFICHFRQPKTVQVNLGFSSVQSLSHVQPLATPWTAAYQAPPSWDFPGKSTTVGCHCLLWKGCSVQFSRSVVSDSSRPHGLQPTRLPVPGILQARVLEWGAIAFSGAFVEGLPVPTGAQRPLVTHSGNGHGGGVMSKR